MKILFAATPASGHVNPLIAIARMVIDRGDEVSFTTGQHFASAVEAAGARFIPLAAEANLDLTKLADLFPERAALTNGPDQLRFDFERIFLDTMAAQAETLRNFITDEAPDIIITEGQFLGRLPLMLDTGRSRPPIIVCGVSFLMLDRLDGAPAGPGLPPARNDEEHRRYSNIASDFDAVFANPVRAYADAKLAALGLPALPYSITQSSVLMADAYLHSTVPAFEYDFGALPPSIHFVGALPALGGTPPPEWWGDLDGPQRIVLVTQGTAANSDFTQLVEPTLAALAHRSDLLVVVTTGGRPINAIMGPIPANARLAPFLDFEMLFPKIDLLVTNGGYGTVSLALRAGVPIVAAGRSEDKAEVGARVAWSGVGVEITTSTPSVLELRHAIEEVLSNDSFKVKADKLAAEFARFNSKDLILAVIDDMVAIG